MNTSERLLQFQEELLQRKALLSNRLKILNANDGAERRIELLEAQINIVREVQELFVDYFYNEITNTDDETDNRGGHASLSVDELINRVDAHDPPNHNGKAAEDQQNGGESEAQPPAAGAMRSKPKIDMSKLTSNINKIKRKPNGL